MMRDEWVSRLLHHIQEIDFDLSIERGIDLAMMKSFIDARIKFRINHRDLMDDGFINLNGKNWMPWSVSDFSWIPLWSQENAINIFNCLVSAELIEIQGDINKGDVLINAESLKT